jgi:hypothetical protein
MKNALLCLNCFLSYSHIFPSCSLLIANLMLPIAALTKAQQLLLDPQERGYLLDQVNAAKGMNVCFDPFQASSLYNCRMLFYSGLIFCSVLLKRTWTEQTYAVLKISEELRANRKKELKKDSASKIKSQVDEVRQSYGWWCEPTSSTS